MNAHSGQRGEKIAGRIQVPLRACLEDLVSYLGAMLALLELGY